MLWLYVLKCTIVALLQTTVCKKIVEGLERYSIDKNIRQHVEVISQDCFYKELSVNQRQLAIKGQLDFDHPGTFWFFCSDSQFNANVVHFGVRCLKAVG